ncbi:MAG TPA: 1-acyl-sn-glycerol-3-phosphate acyltransferase [Flavihumibacter sp.]
MDNLFVKIYRFFRAHRLLFWCCFAGFIAVTALLASRIRLEEDITSIIPRDEKTSALNEIFQQSKVLDKMILTLGTDNETAPDPDSLVGLAGELTDSINEQLAPWVKEIAREVKEETTLQLFDAVHAHLPIFLEEKDYASLDSLTQPGKVRETLERNYSTLRSPAGLAFKQFIARDPAGIASPALRKLQLLQYDQQFELYDNHIITRDGRQLVLFITPVYPKNNTAENAIFLGGLDRLIDRFQARHPDFSVTYYGGTAVAVGNAVQLRKDTLVTQGITVVLLVLFLALYFRRFYAPVLILVPAIMGSLLALAVLALMKGSISVIALATGSIILGIAVNYSLHVFNHFRHQPIMEEVLRDLAHPMTIGSITTIGGFLCLRWVQSDMLRDLGLFAAISLIGASLSSLIFLPHLIRPKKSTGKLGDNTAKLESSGAGEEESLAGENTEKRGWLDRVAHYRLESNTKLVFGIGALTIFFAFFINKVGFEPDMNKMNFMSEKLRKAEQEVNRLNAFALQSVYIVSSGSDLQEALSRNEKVVERLNNLSSTGIIKKYSGLSSILISDSLQKARLERWQQFWTPERKAAVLQQVKTQGAATGFSPQLLESVQTMLDTDYLPLPDSSAVALSPDLLDSYIIRSDSGTKVITLVKTAPNDKSFVYTEFDHQEGVTVLDMQYVTGRLVDMVRDDFNSISWMVAAIVFIVLLISFGRMELTLIAFIPMFITWIWILGIMGLLGIQFNIVNIIISALIFGLGDDYSLFTLDGLLQEYKNGKKNLSSFRSSIFLSALTTVTGLGVLIFAEHPSLRSIALIAILGILCVVLISQVLIPFLFKIMITNRVKKGRQPFTLWSLAKSIFAFTYFVVGSMILTVAGLLMIKLNPFAGERARYAFHWLLSKFCRSLLYIMTNVTKRVVNPHKEDFEKPAVIIANHQSFLDILSLVMLHPRIILLTNDWVWNSPVFGFVVKMADYFPVSKGVENNLDAMRDRVQQGYSIAVFPEGTRSYDGNMKRFHKGAFFLAEELKLDILPIVMHGTGYTMSKGDFILKDGTITIEIGERISPEDTTYGQGYAEKTKRLSRQFKSWYADTRERCETVDWHREKLLYNYLYKGPVLEWYARIKTGLEKNYALFDELVPKKGRILDIGCGYGFMSMMLHFRSKDRIITALDYDEEKTSTAQHCYGRSEELQFAAANALDFPMNEYDAILICDVLHYLPPAAQQQLIRKALDHLSTGGKLIIREGNADYEDRHKGTVLTEFFSTTVFGFNKTSDAGLSFLSASTIREIAQEKGFSCVEMDNSKHTSNIVFVIHKPSVAHVA